MATEPAPAPAASPPRAPTPVAAARAGARAAAMKAPSAAPPPAAPVSRLGKIQKRRIATPTTYVIYGPEGVGKTTLAAAAPNPIFFDVEDGSSELELDRYPFTDDPKKGHVPQTYQQVCDAVDDLATGQHGFRTLVIDSVDRLESLIWKHILERDSVQSAKNKTGEKLSSIEDYGFGKGFNIAVEEWRAFCARLDRLRYAREMEIVLLGHAQVKQFKNPKGDDYDRWQLRVHPQAGGFLKEWAKVTGFMRLEEDVKKLSKHGRAKGFSTNVRVIELARSAAVDAKSRLALPPLVEIDVENPWVHFGAAVAAANQVDPDELVAKIEAEFARIGDEARAEGARPIVQEALRRQDSGKLVRFLSALQQVPSVEAPEGEVQS